VLVEIAVVSATRWSSTPCQLASSTGDSPPEPSGSRHHTPILYRRGGVDIPGTATGVALRIPVGFGAVDLVTLVTEVRVWGCTVAFEGEVVSAYEIDPDVREIGQAFVG
jgi:hypothetical protein